MALFRVTVKTAKNSNGVRIDKGMSVDVVSQSVANPLTSYEGKQLVADAFMRLYGVDLKKSYALDMCYLDVQRIG